MQIIEFDINLKSRSDVVTLYPIGDTHIGKRNCNENAVRAQFERVAKDKYSFWFGGGDLINAIKPQDIKRWDFAELPDWVLDGDPQDIRARMSGVVQQEADRLCGIAEKAKSKCIGLVEGNHEYSIKKYHNDNINQYMCDTLGTTNLTDGAFIRLRFSRNNKCNRVMTLYVEHGDGGGRTAGAEPNHLTRMLSDKDCDMACRGHSHTFCVLPPVSRMYIPSAGKLPTKQCMERQLRAFNWGCYLYSYDLGDSTYERRKSYPARPLMTACFKIKPFGTIYQNGHEFETPELWVEEIKL